MKRNYGCEFISIIKEKWRESKMKEERIHRATYHMRNFEYKCNTKLAWASQAAPVVKNTPAEAGDLRATGSIPGSGRSLGGGHGNPLQYSCLGSLMNRGAWKAMVHSAAKFGHDWSDLVRRHWRSIALFSIYMEDSSAGVTKNYNKWQMILNFPLPLSLPSPTPHIYLQWTSLAVSCAYFSRL